jgi:hypothetical protein
MLTKIAGFQAKYEKAGRESGIMPSGMIIVCAEYQDHRRSMDQLGHVITDN